MLDSWVEAYFKLPLLATMFCPKRASLSRLGIGRSSSRLLDVTTTVDALVNKEEVLFRSGGLILVAVMMT